MSKQPKRSSNLKQDLKIALVHDWLTNFRGGERVLLALKETFPSADIYTSVYNPEAVPQFKDFEIRTTWLQKLPKKLRNFHQLFPVLRVLAFRSLKLNDYDLIITSTSSDAKQVRGGPNTRHICYLFTPTRYYWSHYAEYKKNPGFGKLNPLIKIIMAPMVALMKRLDFKAAQKVDHFVAISSEVQSRIKKYYHRDSEIIFPPADVDRIKFNSSTKNRAGYVVLGAQVAYKRADLAIQAAKAAKASLSLIGDGPEHAKLKALAGDSKLITFLDSCSDTEKLKLLGSFKAQIFPQEEDYGITAIECMAAGTPVLAYAKGGALDTVADGLSGSLFPNQSAQDIAELIRKIESEELKFNPKKVHDWSLKFSRQEFISQIESYVLKLYS